MPIAELFKLALLSNASRFFIAHNHPSGVLEITEPDIELTKKIGTIAKLFDMELLDSIIVTYSGDIVSIREHLKELSKIYKIKDSVDLFLSDGYFLTSYFMNSRRRKSFRINDEMIHLLEQIDGIHTVEHIYDIMENQYSVSKESVDNTISMLLNNKIITELSDLSGIIDDSDYAHYTRQINYFSEFLGSEEEGVLAQKKVMSSHIGIFGCGAIGGNIALQLVMAGVRELTLYDMDIVEESDVSRHMYYSSDSIGMNKVDALKDQLLKIDSKINVHTICSSMKPTDNVEPIIEKLDFAVNTLDEPYIGYTASKISRICIKHLIPHFIAGGFDAHLASTGEIVIPYVTPCVECYANHFKDSLKNWKPKKHPVVRRETEIGGLASMTLFSTSFAAIEIIKYIAGLLEAKDNYKVCGELLFTNLKITYLNVSKDPNCPVCGGRNNNEA